jgi:hypothetical protein
MLVWEYGGVKEISENTQTIDYQTLTMTISLGMIWGNIEPGETTLHTTKQAHLRLK